MQGLGLRIGRVGPKKGLAKHENLTVNLTQIRVNQARELTVNLTQIRVNQARELTVNLTQIRVN